MRVAATIVTALVVYVVVYALLFDDLRDLIKSVGKSLGISIAEEIFPGFAAPISDWARPFIWTFSGLFAGSLVYYLAG